MRLPHFRCSQSVGTRADEGTRTPDRLITNQLLYQLSYIGFFSVSNNSLSLNLRLQKYYFFPNTPKFFFTFRIFLSQQIGLQHHFVSKKTYHHLSTTPQNPHFYTSYSRFSPPEGIKKIPHTHNILIHSIINPTHHSSTPPANPINRTHYHYIAQQTPLRHPTRQPVLNSIYSDSKVYFIPF